MSSSQSRDIPAFSVRVMAAQLAANGTVFVSSACIMVIELAAGRLISRHLGQSLYTWTTIIGVVLAGISLGNYLGGRLADRSCGRRTLAAQFFAAALGCLSVLAVNTWAGEWQALAGLAWPARIFLHIMLVFIVPSMLLGTISPVIARQALSYGGAEGRTIGGVYAWAIAGSIVGTFLTGYGLLMWMGVTSLVMTASGVLAVLGMVYAVGSLLGADGVTVLARESRRTVGPFHMEWREWIGPIATVFAANVCVMAMEIAAGRLMSRNFGQSLFTWTTVIGGVLAGLSLGSYAGGWLADRFDQGRTLSRLFVLSSAACLLAPFVNGLFAAQESLWQYAWPVQIALRAAGVFLLPSFLLGAIVPVVVKTALGQGEAAGRTVGVMYAWGSAGSIVGTFLAGYYLIAAAGTLATFALVAMACAALGLLYARRSVLACAWGALCAIAFIGALVPLPGARILATGLALYEPLSASTIYRDESQYSFIAVWAAPEKPSDRTLILDRLIHSKVDVDNPSNLEYEYEWIYAAVLDKFFPADRPLSAMVIGGGGYAFPHYLEVTRPGSSIDVPEIDSAVTEAAHAAFGLPRNTTVKTFNMDARNHIDDLVRQQRAQPSAPTFDCIFGDSINDYSVPYHLTTHEFNDRLHALLGDDGLYLFNFIDLFDTGRFLGAVVNTCRLTFPYLYVFTSFSNPHIRDTFVVVASKRPLDLTDVPATIRERHPYKGDLLTPGQMDELRQKSCGMILTDDFSPVDNLLAPVVTKSQDTRAPALITAAEALLARGRYDAAIRKCRIVLETGTMAAEAHEILGAALMRKGDLGGAIAALQQSCDEDSSRETAFDNLGQALLTQDDIDGAIEAWGMAVAIRPDFAKGYDSLGAAFIRKRDFDNAIANLKKALELNPTFASAHAHLGEALHEKGDVEGAIQHFQRALAIDPAHPGVHEQLALAYYGLKDYDAAWQHIRAAQSAGERPSPEALESLKRDSGRTR